MPTQLTYDGSFDIAIGRYKNETNWKNQEMLFSAFIDRVSKTQRTHESLREYMALKKPQQDNIKDVGGYVGGYLVNGRRKSGNVLHRQLITLDIDAGAPGMWESFTTLYDSAAAIYSTHKHTPEKPRLRLIMPLDREVGPDEYEAISRRIAGNLGIEDFDPTTFQPSRLMFWPSTSKDAEYFFDYQDGPWISADAVLRTYTNWKDASEWPISQRFNSIVHRNIAKQGDPLEKPGVIGAFCRTYTIEDAIETFLSDVYTPCDVPGRYTYKEGSTSAGLVIYEDRYTFSHHGTDPTSMKLCNAFDLVRLHKFGLRDEDAAEGTPGNKLPSFVAMSDFAYKDVKVRKLFATERFADAMEAFNSNPFSEDGEAVSNIEPELPLDTEWCTLLDIDRKGSYNSTLDNMVLIMENDPRLKGRIALDVFDMKELVRGDLPWRKVTPETACLTERDVANLKHYFEKFYSITGSQNVENAIQVILEKNQVHPVKEYLNGLTWDGIPRIESMLTDYLGVTESPYASAVARKTMAAAVTRIFRPGCKFDYVLTLIGKQGLKKSTLIDKLGGPWFSDSFTTVKGKEAFEQLQGAWLIEIAELSGMRNADVETVKHFITKRKDRYRVAYGRAVQEFPRQCVFFATTNDRTPLRDATGGRRFWGVVVHEVTPIKDPAKMPQATVDQLWAEAVTFYRAKELLYLPDDLEAVAAQMQEELAEVDERAGLVQRYLDTPVPENWEEMGVYDRRAWLAGDEEMRVTGTVLRDKVCAVEICVDVLGFRLQDVDKNSTKIVHNIMQKMSGWEPMKNKRRFPHFGMLKGYYRSKKSVATNFDFAATFPENDNRLLN